MSFATVACDPLWCIIISTVKKARARDAIAMRIVQPPEQQHPLLIASFSFSIAEMSADANTKRSNPERIGVRPIRFSRSSGMQRVKRRRTIEIEKSVAPAGNFRGHVVAEGPALGDTTALANPSVVAAIKDGYEEKEG